MSGPVDLAIEVLDRQAQTAHENQQIHAAEGKLDQAALDGQVFESCLDAIERLKGSA